MSPPPSSTASDPARDVDAQTAGGRPSPNVVALLVLAAVGVALLVWQRPWAGGTDADVAAGVPEDARNLVEVQLRKLSAAPDAGAFAAAAGLLWLAWRARLAGYGLVATAVAVLVTIQIALGIATLLSGVEIVVAVSHQANAALLLIASLPIGGSSGLDYVLRSYCPWAGCCAATAKEVPR